MGATGPRQPLRTFSRRAILGALLGGALIVACSRFRAEDDEEPREVVVVTPTPDPTATEPQAPTPADTPAATATPARTSAPPRGSTATPTPSPTPAPRARRALPPPDPEDLRGFAIPVDDGCLPDSDRLMPNAPREYRNGFHEGVDWYNGLACASVRKGTPVMAMYEGYVIRADHDYVEITIEQINEFSQRTAELGYTEEPILDIYRGRQVWIYHGNGVVTRYAHLSVIVPSLKVGDWVRRGQVVAGIGESGTPEAITAPGTELHLHAEVRIGQSFLGAGLPPGEVRALYRKLFGLDDAESASGG
ncbi:MAG: peptidoglycan DD-metalloendopeptidase family protein [Chloroflexi bacterium]|nr:peptidoglycan DD-metalloendopeptidase family protein [Chloroflexota bacterium]